MCTVCVLCAADHVFTFLFKLYVFFSLKNMQFWVEPDLKKNALPSTQGLHLGNYFILQ